MTVAPLSSLDRSTLRERALVALRAAITTGRYRPGAHLGEGELAKSLGVSRGTVREALRHLQQEGLVTADNRGILRVHGLSVKEVRELFQVRAALEGLAVSEIVKSPRRNSAVATLREALSALPHAVGDLAARVEADLGFHLLLCRLAGNSMLVAAWLYLEGRIRVAIMSSDPDRFPQIMSGDWHAPIVDAIEAGDATTAVRVIEEHLADAADRLTWTRSGS